MNMNDAMETAIQQMRASGVDEGTIEMYRQQMAMAQQMTPDLTQQAAAFAEQMQDNDFQSEMINSFLGDDDYDDNEVVMKPDTKLTPAQQWGIACGADLAFLNGYPLNVLEEDVEQETMKEQLSEWWGIENKEDLIEMLDSLAAGRHSIDFAILDKVTKMNESEGAKLLAESFPDEDDMEVAVDRLDNLLNAYEQFKAGGLWKKATPPNFIAWDLVRRINVCRNGYDAGFISEKEALDIIVETAKRLQKEYSSWRELSIAYQFGRYIWGGDDQYEWLAGGLETLLTNEDSPWVNLDWNMPL